MNTVVPLTFTNPVPLSVACLPAKEVVTVDAKFASSPNAAANSSNVFNRLGAPAIKLLI